MHKPPGFTVMIGLRPHQLASEQDEDNLDREQDQHDHEGKDGQDGDDDIAAEAIVSICRHLHQAGPSAVRDIRGFADALNNLCETFMQHDRAGFEDAAEHACDALHNLISE